jgi:hypothetical protein
LTRGSRALAVLGALALGAQPLAAQLRPPPLLTIPNYRRSEAPLATVSLAVVSAAPASDPSLYDSNQLTELLDAADDVRRETPWWSPLASAVVPGSGQLLMRQRRGVPFVAAEAFLLVQYFSARDDAREFRGEYQRLAEVARSFFTSEFPLGDFEYYERMEQFVESGAFDLDANGFLAPETDTTTFNGFTWRLARRTYWEDPDVPPPVDSEAYQRAIEFYQERAVRDEFRWSWQNAQLEQDLFRQTIQRSNSAFRRTSQFLGVLIANHALSAIDAFVMLRLSRQPGPAGEYRIQGTVPWAPLGRGRIVGHQTSPRDDDRRSGVALPGTARP